MYLFSTLEVFLVEDSGCKPRELLFLLLGLEVLELLPYRRVQGYRVLLSLLEVLVLQSFQLLREVLGVQEVP